jgi:hypothetical protein
MTNFLFYHINNLPLPKRYAFHVNIHLHSTTTARAEAAAARAEAAAANDRAAAANERAAEANQRADVSDQRIKFLENNMADFAQQMAALEYQLSGGSCNTSRPRPTPQHPHYDDDLDDRPKDDLTCNDCRS